MPRDDATDQATELDPGQRAAEDAAALLTDRPVPDVARRHDTEAVGGPPLGEDPGARGPGDEDGPDPDGEDHQEPHTSLERGPDERGSAEDDVPSEHSRRLPPSMTVEED